MSAGAPHPRLVGRYLLGDAFAAGGMASVHLGVLHGQAGFKRPVALKRMHAALLGDAHARATLFDEARLTSRIHHPNVVQTLDVVEAGDELFLVLEYVHGESLDRLLARGRELGQRPPPRVVTGVLAGVLRGLHAAHEALGEDGRPLELVHRDLSPQNLMVDANGVPRVLDFGIARARGRLQGTREGQLKGKLAYLAPEQVHGDASRRSDLFAAGVVLFEALTGQRLFEADSEAAVLSKVLLCRVPTLVSLGVDEPGLQAVLDRALQRQPEDRFETAAQMADALEACGAAPAAELAAWVKSLADGTLTERAQRLEALERAAAAPVPAAEIARPTTPPSRLPLVLTVAVALLAGLGAWQALRAPAGGVDAPVPPPTVGGAVAGSSAPSTEAGPADAGGVDAAHSARGLAVSTGDAAGVDAAVGDVARSAVAPAADAGAARSPASDPGRLPKPRAKPATGCDPPYVIDARGVKRYKVECFE